MPNKRISDLTALTAPDVADLFPLVDVSDTTDAATGTTKKTTGANLTKALSAMVGDSGAGGVKGLVPAPASGDATKVLTGAGTWDTVAGAGGAPSSATYITQTANGSLSNEQAMGSLATGLVKNTTTTGVQSIAVAGTDYVAPSGALGTPSSGTLTNCTADGTNGVGFRNIPQNSQSTAYTTVLGDAGKHLFHPSTDANARTFTIDSNANVAFPIGTAITFINLTSQVVTIAITSDVMYLAGTGTTGSRSLAQYGVATAIKIDSTHWIISGSGLT